ncbi:membrane protein [Mycobacterium pseudoshottsii JCM 15466]|nr:membrane protein [Mycobacterium pseudoshottsii JCM 15466]
MVGGIALLFVVVILVLGFWVPGFFVTTKLDVSKANAGVQQVLTDEANGYGAKNVKDVKCNDGTDPTVKKGATFDCTVSIDGASKHVTVTFQDNKGTYEVGRPQ